MGTIRGICISKERGTQKTPIQEAELVVDWESRGMRMPESGTVR